jgi:hypothetical protein
MSSGAKKKPEAATGLVIDLDTPVYPEGWFGDKPGARVYLRLPSPDALRGFRDECTSVVNHFVLNTKTEHMDLVKETVFDSDRFAELVHGYCVADWDLVDKNGAVIPCDDENKRRIISVQAFLEFIKEGLEDLKRQFEEDKKEDRKNSRSSHDGS